MKSKPDLLQIAIARTASGRLAGLPNRRKQDRDEAAEQQQAGDEDVEHIAPPTALFSPSDRRRGSRLQAASANRTSRNVRRSLCAAVRTSVHGRRSPARNRAIAADTINYTKSGLPVMRKIRRARPAGVVRQVPRPAFSAAGALDPPTRLRRRSAEH